MTNTEDVTGLTPTDPIDGTPLTYADMQGNPPPVMVNIVKEGSVPGFPERATVAKDGLDHWLEAGWSVDS
jgi:hypothetical protein